MPRVGRSTSEVDPLGYAGAIILVGAFLARALWKRGLTTFADLFRERYSVGVERLVVVVLVPGSVIWAAAQVRAFGQTMGANSGLSLVADAVTDVIQGLAVVLGLVLLGGIVAVHVGGVPAGLSRIEGGNCSCCAPMPVWSTPASSWRYRCAARSWPLS